MDQIYSKIVFVVEIGKVNITTEHCIFKLEEDNYIFLVVSDALVYLTKVMHKKCFATFVWDHPFSTYVSPDQC